MFFSTSTKKKGANSLVRKQNLSNEHIYIYICVCVCVIRSIDRSFDWITPSTKELINLLLYAHRADLVIRSFLYIYIFRCNHSLSNGFFFSVLFFFHWYCPWSWYMCVCVSVMENHFCFCTLFVNRGA
jgi:hypothetical protein